MPKLRPRKSASTPRRKPTVEEILQRRDYIMLNGFRWDPSVSEATPEFAGDTHEQAADKVLAAKDDAAELQALVADEDVRRPIMVDCSHGNSHQVGTFPQNVIIFLRGNRTPSRNNDIGLRQIHRRCLALLYFL